MSAALETVKQYYIEGGMTAPPYRLEYAYQYTNPAIPDPMREYLVQSAASRVLVDGTLSGSMRDLVAKGGQLSVDLILAILSGRKEPTTSSADASTKTIRSVQPFSVSMASPYGADGASDGP